MKALLFFLSVSILFAADPPKPEAKPKPWLDPAHPQVQKIRPSASTLEGSIPHTYFTNPVPQITNPYMTTGIDGSDIELQAFTDFVRDQGEWATIQKSVKYKQWLLNRYNFSDERFLPIIKEAIAKGIRVRIQFSFDDCLEWPEGDKRAYSSDFSKMKFKDNSDGRFLKSLLDMGIEFSHPTRGVFSQPVTGPTGGRAPIPHQKDQFQIAYGADGQILKAVLYTGTGNLHSHIAENGQEKPKPKYINRLDKVTDKAIIRFELEHAEAVLNTYAEGGKTSDIEFGRIGRFEYPNGDVYEVAYTDGRYNPWDRFADMNFEAAKNPEKIKITNMVGSQFVITHGKSVKSVGEVAAVQKNFPITLLTDEGFVSLTEFGLSPSLEGFITARPMGPNSRPVSLDLSKRANVYVYQRGVPGFPITDPDGAPVNRYLNHDKSMGVEAVVDGKPRFYNYTGSFNMSGNVVNLERQVLKVVSPDSNTAKTFVESVNGVIHNEPEFAIPMEDAIWRHSIGEMTRHVSMEIPIEKVREFRRHLQDGNSSGMKATLEAIADLPSKIEKRPTRHEVQGRIDRWMGFIDWHISKYPGWYGQSTNTPEFQEYRLRQMATSIALMRPEAETDPYNKRQYVRDILYDKSLGATKEEIWAAMDARLPEALEKIGMSEVLNAVPPKYGDKPEASKPKPVAVSPTPAMAACVEGTTGMAAPK